MERVDKTDRALRSKYYGHKAVHMLYAELEDIYDKLNELIDKVNELEKKLNKK